MSVLSARHLAKRYNSRSVVDDVSISVGAAVYPTDGKNITALFDVADVAMYRNKRRARAGGRDASAD